MKDLVGRIKESLANAKFESVISELKELSPTLNNQQQNQIYDISLTYIRIKRDSLLGIDSDENLRIRQNKLNSEILRFLNQFELREGLSFMKFEHEETKMLKEKIAKGNHQEVLLKLIDSKAIIHPLIYNKILEISANYNTLERDKNLGVISWDDYTTKSNKQLFDLIRIIDIVNDKDFIEEIEKNEHNNEEEGIDDNLVFVITSFDESMEPIYEGIKAAAANFGLEAKRVKDVNGDYLIDDKMLEMIRQAKFVVTDLSYERPNVYFEHGYAKGLGKKTITICREGEKIHFDVRNWKYLTYNDSRVLEKKLIERFNYELGK